MPFGKNCRSSPFVFSFVPRCHREYGSQQNTGMPVAAVSSLCAQNSLPLSTMKLFRNFSGVPENARIVARLNAFPADHGCKTPPDSQICVLHAYPGSRFFSAQVWCRSPSDRIWSGFLHPQDAHEWIGYLESSRVYPHPCTSYASIWTAWFSWAEVVKRRNRLRDIWLEKRWKTPVFQALRVPQSAPDAKGDVYHSYADVYDTAHLHEMWLTAICIGVSP